MKMFTLKRTSNQTDSEADCPGVIAVREDPGNNNIIYRATTQFSGFTSQLKLLLGD